MTALEGKLRLVVIEERRLPLVVVVASFAVAGAIAKLVGMRVFVASHACFLGFGKVNVDEIQLHVRRLVAVGAGHGAMRTEERKVSLGVVELGEIFPFFG